MARQNRDLFDYIAECKISSVPIGNPRLLENQRDTVDAVLDTASDQSKKGKPAYKVRFAL